LRKVGVTSTEGGFKECRHWDNTGSSLVFFRTCAQPEEEDSTDESVEVEGGISREGKG
jgi:hypothetical protein